MCELTRLCVLLCASLQSKTLICISHTQTPIAVHHSQSNTHNLTSNTRNPTSPILKHAHLHAHHLYSNIHTCTSLILKHSYLHITHTQIHSCTPLILKHTYLHITCTQACFPLFFLLIPIIMQIYEFYIRFLKRMLNNSTWFNTIYYIVWLNTCSAIVLQTCATIIV